MFKQTFKLFLESKELGLLRPRPLSVVELSKTKASVSAIILIHDLVKKAKDKITPQEVIDLHKQLGKFAKVKFVAQVLKDIEKMIHAYDRSLRSGDRILSSHSELKNNIQSMKAAFMKKDFKAGREHKAKLDAQINDVDHHINLPHKAHTELSNQFTSQPSIFGTMRLLSTIGDNEYNKVRALDFSKTLYTAVDFPSSKEDDFDYVMYFLLHLSDSPKPVRIDREHDFRLHTKVQLTNDVKYKKLMRLMDRYLHSNDHSLIGEIIKLINAIPSIRTANEKAKRSIKVVYRGLGFNEDDHPSNERILKKERERKYVATSKSKHTAKNFALQKGHLEHDDSRRSENGVIIVYHVQPDAILFDTRVVDTAYNESEILIDATKAEVADIIEV